jgi:hypothetical protein
MEKEECGKKRGLKETECVGHIAKNWILGERKMGVGGFQPVIVTYSSTSRLLFYKS